MGRRDFRQRETKKQKRGAKKPDKSSILVSSPEPEIIKTKGKKEEG